MPDLDVVRLLASKRDGARLAPEAITALVAAYTEGDVPDYQMAAFLMAAFIRGMDEAESAALTRAMLHSGEVLHLVRPRNVALARTCDCSCVDDTDWDRAMFCLWGPCGFDRPRLRNLPSS